MKPFWKDVILSCILGLIIPWMMLSVSVAVLKGGRTAEEPTVAQVVQDPPEQTISVLHGDEVRQMDLSAYLTGVVLAEMPASFHEEALKAQAVVARTYTIRASDGRQRHDDASVCTDSTCCQGYTAPEDYLARGGNEDSVDKIRSAVEATAGYVLTYEGKLIEATYFSCSGGTTEDAVAVWGTEVPYLRSVDSPGEEDATHFTDTVTFSPEEFQEALDVTLVEDPDDWFGKTLYTAGGGVDSMVIGDKSYGGTELRKLLGLRSTAFSVEVRDDRIVFTTRGYGHRVGMSQYGADAMAELGSTCAEILAHYYPGAVLEMRTD